MMADTKTAADTIKTLDNFRKQLHMYAPDQLRNALKISIGIANDAIISSKKHEALMTGFARDEGIIIFPTGTGFRAQAGDDVLIEVDSKDEGIRVYRAKVDGVKNEWGDKVYHLKGFALQQRERRGAQRFSVHIQAKYDNHRDGGTRQALSEGTVLNISTTGLYLASDKPMQLGSGIVFMRKIGLESMEVPSGTPGTIVRGKKEENSGYLYSYGVKFDLPFSAA